MWGGDDADGAARSGADGAGDGGGPSEQTAAPGPPRWRLPLLLTILAVVVVGGGWTVMAARAVSSFEDEAGGASGPCTGGPSEERVRPPRYATSKVPDELLEVAEAYDAYFAQERWRFTDVQTDSDDPNGDLTFSADGDILRRQDEDGFTGLMRGSDRVAQFDGDRFWVPACVNGATFPFGLPEAECISSSPEAEGVRFDWAKLSDGTTCDDAGIRFSTTVVDGLPTEWTMSVADRFTSTTTAEEPVSVSWPSPVWIAPTFLTGHGED